MQKEIISIFLAVAVVGLIGFATSEDVTGKITQPPRTPDQINNAIYALEQEAARLNNAAYALEQEATSIARTDYVGSVVKRQQAAALLAQATGLLAQATALAPVQLPPSLLASQMNTATISWGWTTPQTTTAPTPQPQARPAQQSTRQTPQQCATKCLTPQNDPGLIYRQCINRGGQPAECLMVGRKIAENKATCQRKCFSV